MVIRKTSCLGDDFIRREGCQAPGPSYCEGRQPQPLTSVQVGDRAVQFIGKKKKNKAVVLLLLFLVNETLSSVLSKT